MNKTERFWRAVGGRKMGNGYLYAVLITVVAAKIDPFPFDAYALYLSLALLGTSALVGMEDAKSGGRRFPRRRAADVDTPEAG